MPKRITKKDPIVKKPATTRLPITARLSNGVTVFDEDTGESVSIVYTGTKFGFVVVQTFADGRSESMPLAKARELLHTVDLLRIAVRSNTTHGDGKTLPPF